MWVAFLFCKRKTSNVVPVEVGMIDIEFKKLLKSGTDVKAIGFWLDENMPNPPLPDEQRWTIGHSADGRTGIHFANDQDSTLFLLRWS